MLREDRRAIIIVMLGFALSTLTGFGRQVILAQQLGVGSEADIYLVAFAFPEFVFIALPIVLYPAFIPLYADWRRRLDKSITQNFIWQTAIGLSLFLLALSAIAALGAPVYLRWLSPGFDADERTLAVRAARIMSSSLCLMGLATLTSGILQVRRRFAASAFLTAVYNVIFVISLFALPTTSLLERASWAVTLGAAAAFAFQLPFLWNSLRKIHLPDLPADWSSYPARASGLIQVLSLAGPLTAGYAIHHLILFIDQAMATTLSSGSVAALNYAHHLALVISQLSGVAISTVVFPRLAEQVNQNNLEGTRASLANALHLVWLIALPASVGLIILRHPITAFVFERGAFDPSATLMVSRLLVWYGLAVLADSMCQPLWRVVYAQKSAWTVFLINGLQTIIRLLGNILLLPFMGYAGLALSSALGLLIQALILGWLVYRYLGAYWSPAWQRSMRQVVYAAVGAALTASLLTASLSGLRPILQISLAGLASALVFFAILGIFHLASSPSQHENPFAKQ